MLHLNHPGVPSPRLLSPQRTVSLLRLCLTTRHQPPLGLCFTIRRQPLLRPSCGVPSFALADLTTAFPTQHQSTPRRAIASLASAMPSRCCASPHHRIGCPYPSGPRSAIATLVFAISVLRRSVLCRAAAVPCFSVPWRFHATLCLCPHLNPNPCLFCSSHCHCVTAGRDLLPVLLYPVRRCALPWPFCAIPQPFTSALCPCSTLLRLCQTVHVCSLPVPLWSALCLCRVFDELPVETTFTGIPPLTKSVKNSIVHDLGDQVFDLHPACPNTDFINRRRQNELHGRA